MSDVFVSMLRREFRKIADGIMVGEDEVREMLRREVLKQDVLQGDECAAAASKVNWFYRAVQKKAEKSSVQKSMIDESREVKVEETIAETTSLAEGVAAESSIA